MNPAPTHLVMIPAYNPGTLLSETVLGALASWSDVWVVVDASTDGSHEAVLAEARKRPGLRVLIRETNGGKGAAVLTGAREAIAAGFTHALVMDADGQHPAGRIRPFMEASMAAPGSLVCGRPTFGPDAPVVRLLGRKLSVGLVRMETSGRGAADPLFGFRVYPLAPLVSALEETRGARRYDFDPEMAVRLAWAGTPAVNMDAACVYVARARGGVSHFRYLRDNLRMVAMHARLIGSLILGRREGTPRMRLLSALLACLSLSSVAGAAEIPGELLSPGTGEGEWRPLIDALAAKGTVVAPFEEHRYFIFRHIPLVLKGVLRISRERGLSLQYTEPDPSIMIADSSGLLLREPDGRTRDVPAGSRQSGAIAALLPIMQFDLAALYPRFEIHARRTGADWMFEFTPRDPEVARSLGEIFVGGTGTDVHHLEFRRSASQRVETTVGDTRSGVAFTPAELARYFR